MKVANDCENPPVLSFLEIFNPGQTRTRTSESVLNHDERQTFPQGP